MTDRSRPYTATGILRLDPALPVAAIGVALMDSAADVDENSSVAIDLERSVVEIEAIVTGVDELVALATAKSVVHRICDLAVLPTEFAADRRLRPSEWHLVDDAVVPPVLASG